MRDQKPPLLCERHGMALTDHLAAHDQVQFLGLQERLYDELLYVEYMGSMPLSTEHASYDASHNITGAAPPHLLAPKAPWD